MNDHQKELIAYRLEQAEESLQSAKLLFENEKYRPAVNRSYYTMFYSVLALIVTKNNSVSKHSGVISIFDRDYVKKGVFSGSDCLPDMDFCSFIDGKTFS